MPDTDTHKLLNKLYLLIKIIKKNMSWSMGAPDPEVCQLATSSLPPGWYWLHGGGVLHRSLKQVLVCKHTGRKKLKAKNWNLEPEDFHSIPMVLTLLSYSIMSSKSLNLSETQFPHFCIGNDGISWSATWKWEKAVYLLFIAVTSIIINY